MPTLLQRTDFCSEGTACSLKGNAFTAMISITEPGRTAPIDWDRWGDFLCLRFDDIIQEDPRYISFTPQMADQVLDFLEKNSETMKTILVHCAMGISRSAAVSLFIAETYHLSHFDYVKASRYNRHVYKTLWDRYEARHGVTAPFPTIEENSFDDAH